jgi:precorrin-8X/cobalt-precorrin-8 methylmutase
MLEPQIYLRDGNAIYERSFAIIRAEADLSRFSLEEAEIAIRMIHACGMVEIADRIVFGGPWSHRPAMLSLGARRSCATPKWWPTVSHGRDCRHRTR